MVEVILESVCGTPPLGKVNVRTREKGTTFGQGGCLFAISGVPLFLIINVEM